ncbi:hypothetical protein [Lactobacillus delbrueckii]|nr:hypothetical protein [Lactobacillus delbrueckii]GHN17275.1 hypothetical protein ME782_17360 [Lactobacillus delbrueckii]GHN49910.1 hypothetical protein ME800_15190 [Lactobacillus delbrueckii]
MAEIKAEEKAVLKQILLDELGLPLLPDDLDYALKQAEKKLLFRI